MVVKLIVRKIPRDGKLIDYPINFPKLENLHLDLMEVKAKLKQGLPIIPKPDGPVQLKRKYVFNSNGNIIDYNTKEVYAHLASRPEHRVYNTGKYTPDEDDDLVARFGKKKLHKHKPEEDAISIGGSVDEADYDDEYGTEDEDAHLTPEEKEAKDRQEYLWRFKILRKQYKDNKEVEIPKFTEFSDVGVMKVSYNQTVKELYLDESVQSYKMYLIGGFLATEYLGTQYLGIDLTGFTKMQLSQMAKYERMLIELGEKSYMQWGNNIPVEARILGTIVLQAGIFWMGKIISQKAGNNIGGMIQMFMGGAQGGKVHESASNGAPPKRGGMRGPSVKVI